jgi:transmembrane sensor
MNTASDRLTELLNIYVSGEATELEKMELWDYVDDPLYSAQLNVLLSESFEKQNDEYALQTSDRNLVLEHIFKAEDKSYTDIKKVTMEPWFAYTVAAAITILIFGIFFYNSYQDEKLQQSALANINPARNGATLTLANGKRIKLEDAKNGQIAKEANLVITKKANGQLVYTISTEDEQLETPGKVTYNTLSTAKGETFSVRLPDGSLVQLNAASSITYSSSLKTDDIRNVKLKGEGYFEIAKIYQISNKENQGKRTPFIVNAGRQQIEVLGTHFNVTNYSVEKQITTTLLEGAVRLTTFGSLSKTSILKPNQQSILSPNNELSLKTVDVQNAVAWKNGFFYFSDAHVEDILREFARWYDLEIEYTGTMPDRLFTGELYRNLSFAEALKILDFAKVKFKIEGRKVIVSP